MRYTPEKRLNLPANKIKNNPEAKPMFNEIKKTLSHSTIFALGKMSAKLVGFILLPIYTKNISVQDYGILGVLEIIDLLGGHILSVGIPQAILRWYNLAKEEIEKKKILFSSFGFILSVNVIFVALILLFHEKASSWLFSQSQFGSLLIIVSFSIIFTNLARIAQTLLRIEEKSVLYSISVLGQFTVSLILNIVFVAFWKWGIKGVLLANMISTGCLFLILLPYLIKKMAPKFDSLLLKEMLAFSYPFILTAIAVTILNMGDRYLLSKLSTLTEVGLYSLGYKYSNVLKIFVVDPFALGLPIIAWQIAHDEKKIRNYLSKISTYLSFVLLWIGLFITIYSKGILHLIALNKDYWDAYRVVPFLTLGVVFFGIQQVFYFSLQVPKKTKNISLIISLATLLNIISNLIFIPYWGMMASAVITVLSNVFAAALAYSQMRKHFRFDLEIVRLVKLFATASLLYSLSLWFDVYPTFWRISSKALLLLSYPFILYFLKFYDQVEIDKFIQTVKKISNPLKRFR